MRIVTLILVIAAVAIAGYPLALQYQSSLKLAQTSRNSAQQVAGWPYPQAEDAPRRRPRIQRKTRQIRSTRAGRGHRPVQRRTRRVESQRRGLRRLQRQGIPVPARLGRRSDGNHQDPENLRQPADLPRTSQTALASGAGHLYGSSLPVGGDSTHSVITGHRGLVNAMMFTRLER